MNTLKWVKRFRKSSRLRAVIGLKPQIALMNFNVEAWSMYRRKSPMKNDVVELDGLQTLHLAEAGGGNRRIEPTAKTAIE